MRRVVIIVFSVVVAAILFMVLCTFVKKPYEEVLIIRFGSIIDEGHQSRIAYNWYFKFPTDSVVRMDTRLHLFTSPLQQMVTAGAEPISVQTFAAWRIANPEKFYKTIQGSDEQAKRTIGQKLSGLVQAKLANHRLDEIFNTDESKVHTDEIEKEVATEASKGTPDPTSPTGMSAGISDQGLEIVQVGFSRMAFPPANANPVYARMAAERDTQAMAFLSQGRSESEAIKAQGAAQATEIRAKAVAQAEQIKGDGDRQALQILAAVQQSPSSREFYQYWKSMEFVKSAFTKNTYLVLSAGSDLLKPVFNAPVAGKTPETPETQATPANGAVPLDVIK